MRRNLVWLWRITAIASIATVAKSLHETGRDWPLSEEEVFYRRSLTRIRDLLRAPAGSPRPEDTNMAFYVAEDALQKYAR